MKYSIINQTPFKNDIQNILNTSRRIYIQVKQSGPENHLQHFHLLITDILCQISRSCNARETCQLI